MVRAGETGQFSLVVERAVPNVFLRTFARFTSINGQLYAAAISYFVVISLFPWLIFLVTLLALLRDPVLQAQVVNQIVDQFPEGARIRTEIRAFVSEISVRRSGLLGVIGLVSTIVVASQAFRALRVALDALFGITQQRSFFRARGIDLLGMLAVLVFALISAGLTALLRFDWVPADFWLAGDGARVVRDFLRFFLPFLLSFGAFTLMYRVVPEVKLPWNELWQPGLIAATGFELAKHGMALFLAYFERFQQLYGALSVTVVLLVFVFVVANLILLALALSIERKPGRWHRERTTLQDPAGEG